MFENNRTKKLALIGAAALVLGLAAVAPAFAWHVANFRTTILCDNDGTWAACTSSQLLGINTPIKDEAILLLSDNGKPYGNMSFYVYQGTSKNYTLTNNPDYYQFTCTLKTGKSTAPKLVWTDPANVQDVGKASQTSPGQIINSSEPSFTQTGSFFFYVVYSGSGSNGYPPASTCEPFIAPNGTFPPPTFGTPQFPFGMALLLAVAIPGLLLVRSKFASKHSSFSSVR